MGVRPRFEKWNISFCLAANAYISKHGTKFTFIKSLAEGKIGVTKFVFEGILKLLADGILLGGDLSLMS